MKYLLFTSILLLSLSSCITTTHVHYSDPNYLNSDEFSTYEEMTANNQEESESFTNDTVVDSGAEYTADDYYDYSFSSRIRRFHRPIYYSGYYGGIYTDYYWYNSDPFSCGTSIYYGYNWHSPYYSYYSYSPYYYGGYYTPYYYGGYYSYNRYKHQYNNLYNTYYTNNNHNSYITGRRGRLSLNGGGRSANMNTTNNILSNTTKKTSTLNIRNNKFKVIFCIFIWHFTSY